MAVDLPKRTPAAKQLRLFGVENPLASRFGLGFFRALPREPGVYFFKDAEGKILYVGQSHDLRKRVGSYRNIHPDRHPRRLVKLVHAVATIDWELCATSEEAIRREGVLLLELRPKYNRMGVWIPPPWWVTLDCAQSRFASGLVREVPSGQRAIGPLPSGYRYVHHALMRCLYRWLHPEVPFCNLPAGMLAEKPARLILWSPPALPEGLGELLEGYILRNNPRLLEILREFFSGPMPHFEQQYWAAAMELLEEHMTKAPYKDAAVRLSTLAPLEPETPVAGKSLLAPLL